LEVNKKTETGPITIPLRAPSKALPRGINIAGIGNLLTHTARCCKPVPGDAILGFITQGNGVAIHKQECRNLLNLTPANQARIVEVDWGSGVTNLYPVDIYVQAYDRPGLVRDVTTLLANEKLNLLRITTHMEKSENIAHVSMTLEISDISSLSKVFDRIKNIPNVIEVMRQTGSH